MQNSTRTTLTLAITLIFTMTFSSNSFAQKEGENVSQGEGQKKESIKKNHFKTIYADIINKRIDEFKNTENNKKLITGKAFNMIAKNDFEKTQTVTSVNKVTNRFASLDINKEKQTFSFSPYVYDFGQHILGINFIGALNSKDFFDFKDRNQVAVGLNYTFYHVIKKFNNISKHKDEREKIYDIIKAQTLDNAYKKQIGDIWIKTDSPKYLSKEEFEEKLTEYEIAFADKYWVSKHIFWATINFTPFNKDNFRYLIEGDIDSYQNPYKKSFNVLKFSTSFNYYFESKNWIVSPSVNVSGTNKHSLSEIYTTKQWNKITSLTDEIYLSEDNKNVYILSDNKFSRLFLIDFGLECILLSKMWNMGLDVSYNSTNFITPETSNNKSKIENYSVGIIIPFADNKGQRTINIVPFYAYKQYIDYSSASENVLGIKFNVPLK